MRKRWIIRNPDNNDAVALRDGTILGPGQATEHRFSTPEIERFYPDIQKHGLEVVEARPRYRQHDALHEHRITHPKIRDFAEKAGLLATPQQTEYYRRITEAAGVKQELPAGLSRQTASDLIETFLMAHPEIRGKALPTTSTSRERRPTSRLNAVSPHPADRKTGKRLVYGGCMQKVITDRLYSVSVDHAMPEHLRDVTLLIDMGSGFPAKISSDAMMVRWPAGENVDEQLLIGLVALCARTIRSKGQRVLLVGSQEAIDVLAACILRAYVGCDSDTAIKIIRDGNPARLREPALLETVSRLPI